MKKTIFFSLFAALLMPVAAAADSYTSLWKKFESAKSKDHPQTVLKVLSEIRDKAAKERAYGHLLKAQISTIEWQTAVTPDSLESEVTRLREWERRAVASGDNVLAAVYQSALGTLYSSNAYLLDDGKAIAARYFKESMSHPADLAAAYSTSYSPFVVDGIDSKYYYDDMLHVIGIRAGDYTTMHDYYASHGKREGACLTALEIVKKARKANDVGRLRKSKYIMSLDSLAYEYGDLAVCGEVAIERYQYMQNADDVTAEEKMNYINYALSKWGSWQRMNILRNAQRSLTLPSFHASLGGELALPGVPRNINVMALTNVEEVKVVASRLDIDGTTTLDPSNDKEYATLRRHIIATEAPITDSRHYVGLPSYATVNDTLTLGNLRSGVYLVEMSTDNESVPTERKLLRVCNIYPIIEALPGNKLRFVVLNATTGTVMPCAKVDVYTDSDDDKATVKTYTCDANGEVYVENADKEIDAYRVYTDTEKAFPRMPIRGGFYYNNTSNDISQSTIYTDRSIYRPGQTVRVAAIAYSYSNKDCRGKAMSGKQMTLTLRNANRQEVASKTVTTDDYGMATVDFTLPQGTLNGMYTIQSDFGTGAYTNFSVEEYKRPTFSVEINKAGVKYEEGDTVRLNAMAKSFAGVPIQGARVAVKVVRRPAMFWRCSGTDMRSETVMTDTVQTASDGTFSVAVPIKVPDAYEDNPRRYYVFDISADVTSTSGETRHGEMSLPYSDYPTILTCDVPSKTLADSLQTITFTYRNNAGEPIDGDVTYSIDSHSYTCKANVPTKISRDLLTTARHRLMAVCGNDTITTSFVTFNATDRHAPVETHDWFWLSADRFPSDGKPVYLQVGSTDSIQHIVYTILSGDKILEEGRADLFSELRTRAISYKPEWGDGITISMAWVKSGHSYNHTVRIMRPLPDTRLNMTWTTFRDRLTPGQNETWTLHITHPDGTPARAQLLATLYDKSLDEIRPHNIRFSLPIYANLPWLTWRGVSNNNMIVYSEMPVRFLDEHILDFSHFADCTLLGSTKLYFACEESCVAPGYGRRPSGMSRAMANDMMAYEAPEASDVVMMSKKSSGRFADEAVEGGADEHGNSEKSNAPTSQLRENLQETAFFYPGLLSDEKGNVSLKFTLPESVTTWQLYGMAHDKDMNNGLISATAVAKKTVMVQPNVPRFVRSADHGTLLALISNTSDKAVSGTACLTLLNPETGKEVYRKEKKFSAKAGESVAADFDFDMSKIAADGLLVCRVTASGRGFSDGEQHYLPVLPDKELVVNTKAFSQNGASTHDIDLRHLFDVNDKSCKLTVEYTNSPAWLMVQALPSLAYADGDNAISLSAAYYANSLAKHILNATPSIKQTIELWQREAAEQKNGSSLASALQKNEDLKQIALAETPWLLDANRDAEQKSQLADYFDASQVDYRLNDNIARLQRVQNGDGSFAWWKGMGGSSYITMAVLKMLVRLNYMVGQTPETTKMTDAAFAYMDRQMAHEVADMKKLEATQKSIKACPSQTAVEYLYATTLAKRKLTAKAKQNFDFLLSRLAERNGEFTIYGKAMAAVTLGKNNFRKEATDLLESLRQYTVCTDEMGRYFDTPKAINSWFDYRIPTEVAAIEALRTLTPADKQTIGEMQRWLLQSKRTQAWDTPLNSVDAVYAFLEGNDIALSNDGEPAKITLDGESLTLPKATAALGGVKVSKAGGNFKQLTIEKTSDGTSWGAVYAQFLQPTTDVKNAATGMKVTRELYKNGKPLAASAAKLRVGDCITVRLTIVADRDYDFVQLSDRRAACLEPAQQLSGYTGGYYCQPKDNATNYFFDMLSKGKHVVETTYYADRAGTYQTGTCFVQCAYAPEFCARAKAATIEVEK